MSNQEMQFADPDWKPSQQLDTNHKQQEEYTPQPINKNYREQSKWGSAPSSPPQQEGYTGLRPYTGPVPGQMQGGNYRQRPYSRRGRGPWLWIILAFIIFGLMSGGWHSFGGPRDNGPGYNPFNRPAEMVKPIDYAVSGQASIVINDPNGNITVIEGQSNSDVSIQPVDANSFPGNPNDIRQNISQNGNTITANIQDSTDLQVTVPEGANVNLNTGSGDINYDATFGTTGALQFQTTNGNITVTMPSSSAFHLDASTSSGTINSNVPNIHVQDSASGSGQSASGDVGAASQSQLAKLIIRSDSGGITVNRS